MNRIGLLGCAALAAMIFTVSANAAEPAAAPASAPAALPPLAQIPASAFAALPFIEDPQISPDGTAIAGLIALGGHQVIAAFKLTDLSDHPVRIGVPDATQANWVHWVGNDNILVGLSAQQYVDVRPWTVSRLIGINRTSGKISKLLWDAGGQNAADVLHIAHDGSDNVTVAAQQSIFVGDKFWPSVYRVNIKGGLARQMLQGHDGVLNWSADAAGRVRAGMSYDDNSRKFKLHYRSENTEIFHVVETANSREHESLLEPFLFLPGTDHALATHDDDHGMNAVYEIDLNTQADVRTVYSAPAGGEVSGAIVAADGLTLIGVRQTTSTEPTHWFDPDLAKLQAGFNTAVSASGGRRAEIISLSDDRQRMLVRVDRPDSPGAIYFFDTGGDRMQLVSQQNQTFGRRPLSPVKLVHYTARDGTPIEAVLTLPGDRAQTALPIVIMPHGGPWANDTADYDYWAQFIASRGYAVIQPNFRGSTGYGTEFLRKGEGQMGLAMQDDLSDALAWAAKQGIADPKRACIIGGSYGGYAAMWGIAKDPDQYRCAVSIAGVANVRREVNDFGDNFMGGKFQDDWKRMSPDFAAISPINAVARIKAPLLLIHGKKDLTVDYSQSTKMNDKMKAAGKQVEFLSLPEADHHFTREADRTALLVAIESFLARYNPADGMAVAAAATAK